jgi:hypothetical protein
MGPMACGLVAGLIDWIEGPRSEHGRPRCPTQAVVETGNLENVGEDRFWPHNHRESGKSQFRTPAIWRISAKDTLKKAENATVGKTKLLIFHDLESAAWNFSVFP